MFGKELLVRKSCPDPEQNSSAWDCSQDNKTTADKEHGASVGLTLLPEKKNLLPFDLAITQAHGGTVFDPQRAR